ncbi:type II secretion system protein GspL [Pseudoalteromonas fenneropenaei]|uniref:Type II secretion system protein L n=1 Tax=Pseudoalteromonas fenneropenaei TaxID=1737459 RepID=A0ABV7CQB6_9GAMM
MTEKLLIRVGFSKADPVHWLIWSATQEIIASGELTHCDFALLAEKAQQREVVLLLPSDQVQLKTVTLPTKWGRKLEQALPYMLEEQLATDIDSVFVAVAEPVMIEERHGVRVALCDESWLAEWLDAFAAEHIEINRALPDALLLPAQAEAGHCSLLQLGEQWLCRMAEWQVAVVETTWFGGFIQALKPQQLHHLSPLPAELAGTVECQAHPEQYDLPLAIFAKQLSALSFNLRQGRFAARKKKPQWRSDWRSGMIAAGIALVAFVGVKSAQLFSLSSEVDKLREQSVAAYQEAFPGKVVRPHLLRSQLRNELAQLQGGPSTSFLKLTEQFVSVFNEVKQFSPETIRFDSRRNELRVRARGKDFQTFGQVKALLEQRGLSVEQGSLSNDGDIVVGELKIKGA